MFLKHRCMMMNSRLWQVFCVWMETLETYRHHRWTNATYTPPCMSVDTPSTFFPTTYVPSWSIMYSTCLSCPFCMKERQHACSIYLLITTSQIRVRVPQKLTRPWPRSPPCHSSACHWGLRTAWQRGVKIGKSTRPHIQMEKSPIQQVSATVESGLGWIGHGSTDINQHRQVESLLAPMGTALGIKKNWAPNLLCHWATKFSSWPMERAGGNQFNSTLQTLKRLSVSSRDVKRHPAQEILHKKRDVGSNEA